MLATALFACGTAVTNTGVTGGSTSGVTGGADLSPLIPIAAGYGIATLILGAGLLTLVLIVALSRRGDPKPVPAPVGATVSPDGLYWWDGANWRPTR